MIYLDNASTSWPKPEPVYTTIDNFLREKGGNPSRGGHVLAREAARVIEETRSLLARLFNVTDPKRIVFTKNVTEALNLAIKGLLQPGDHVLMSGMEHNAVARPLYALERQGVELDIIPCNSKGLFDVQQVEEMLRPNTRLICVTHASNVSGGVIPVDQIGKLVKSLGIFFLVDAAQTAGIYPIDVQQMGIDLLAFTGHKGLLGPPGTGGLCLAPELDLDPLIYGGTGRESFLKEQPAELPDRMESGTLNSVGLAGLGAGIKFIKETGIDIIRDHEINLANRLMVGLRAIDSISVYGPDEIDNMVPVISFNIRGWKSEEVAYYLDSTYEVAVRGGLHCAPLAHISLGTYPDGAVRCSLSYFNNEQEIQRFLEILEEISK